MRPNRARFAVTVAFLILALVTPRLAFAQPSGTNGPVKRVLVLHSFGRDFAPFSVMSATFRTELARRSPVPVEFHEASIEMARFSEMANEQPVADYLEALFKERRLDLILTMGGPATLFVNRHREQLFPEVPVVATMDQRRVKESGVSTNMTAVTLDLNLPGLIEDILQVRPATTNVFVVFGVSPFERYWAAQCQREFAAFTNRVTFTWLNELSLEAMTKRVATLPHNSVVWYGAMVTDAAGVPHEQETALAALRASANAPIFGVFEHQLGLGIVGGRLTSNEAWGRRTAEVALRILSGEPPDQIKSEPTGPGIPTYDWRELRRWNISEKRLPPGSIVRLRPPSLWENHKDYVIGGVVILLAQTLTIALLLVQARRRKVAQRAFMESEERMALAAEAANLGYWVRDLVHKTIWASSTWRAVFGFGESDPLSWQDVLHRLHPDDRQILAQALAKASAGGGHYDAEYRVVLPDGQVRWIASRGRVECGRDGQPARIRGVSADITRRKESEEKLRESEGFKKAILDSVAAHIAVLDGRGEIIAVNARWQQFALENLPDPGLPVPNVGIGVNYLEVCLNASGDSAETAKAAHDGIKAVLENRMNSFVLEYGCNSPQKLRWFTMLVTPLNQMERSVVVSHFDITERKQAELELAEQRNELAHLSRVTTLSELSGSLAHELNQPLAIILTNAQAAQRLLAQSPPDLAEASDILADIVSEDQRAGEVIRRLRSLLKPGETNLQPISANEILEDVLRIARSDLIGRGVTVHRALSGSLPSILGDRVQLQQVLLNLILNACDAMNGNPPARQVLSLATMHRDGVVRVSVTDSGCGLPPDVEQVFTPFYTTKKHGLGLGLSICRSIVTVHKGRLWAEANADSGATFHLELPAVAEGK